MSRGHKRERDRERYNRERECYNRERERYNRECERDRDRERDRERDLAPPMPPRDYLRSKFAEYVIKRIPCPDFYCGEGCVDPDCEFKHDASDSDYMSRKKCKPCQRGGACPFVVIKMAHLCGYAHVSDPYDTRMTLSAIEKLRASASSQAACTEKQYNDLVAQHAKTRAELVLANYELEAARSKIKALAEAASSLFD